MRTQPSFTEAYSSASGGFNGLGIKDLTAENTEITEEKDWIGDNCDL